MNEKKVARILDDCLSAIRSGKMNKADCVRKYPDLEGDLDELLGTAEKLYLIPDIAMEKGDLRKMKMQLLNRLPDRKQVVTKPSGSRYKWQTTKRRFAMTWIIIVTTLLSLLSGAGAVYASGDALPGDVLYPVKTWVEGVQLAVATDDADTELLSKFSEYRVQEMVDLYEEGRFDDLDETVEGYQNLTQLLEQLMAEIQANDPDAALKLRTKLEQELQEHARIIEGLIEDDSGEDGELDHVQLQEMLQTNSQIRLRVFEDEQESMNVESDSEMSSESVDEESESEAESTDSSGSEPEIEGQDHIGELVNAYGNTEMVSFTFRLQNAPQNGVYAELAGVQYPCIVEGELVTCNISSAPSEGTINLYSQSDNEWLYAYEYEYDFDELDDDSSNDEHENGEEMGEEEEGEHGEGKSGDSGSGQGGEEED